MNAATPTTFRFTFLFVLLGTVACSARSSVPGTSDSAVSAASSVCGGKACGVDCTPEGSDEPFNCNAAGECVATGQPLGCEAPKDPCVGKACGVDCTPEGSDEPFNCNAAGKCTATGEPLGCK
jgi:hypothetical protein